MTDPDSQSADRGPARAGAVVVRPSGQIATGRRYFPSVPVTTHHGERRLFYDDLVRGRAVLVQFFSIVGHSGYPVARNLVEVQRLLGDRLGRDVFMYSITTDPADDPASLTDFARRHDAGPGWLFLTGAAADLTAVKEAFFFHDGGGHGPAGDCSRGLLRYGNESAGLWGSTPTKTDPAQIVQRLDWISPRPRADGLIRRRGPISLG